MPKVGDRQELQF